MSGWNWGEGLVLVAIAAVGYAVVAGVMNLRNRGRATPPPDAAPEAREADWRAPKPDLPPNPPPVPPPALPSEAERGWGRNEFERVCSDPTCRESNAPSATYCRKCGAKL